MGAIGRVGVEAWTDAPSQILVCPVAVHFRPGPLSARHVTMRVTDLRLTLISRPGSRVVAYASVVLDEALIIHGVRVIRTSSGLVVALPDQRGRDGVYRPVVEWVSTPVAEEISRAVVLAVEHEMARPERVLADRLADGVPAAPPASGATPARGETRRAGGRNSQGRLTGVDDEGRPPPVPQGWRPDRR